jgi:hypothetical protein
VGRGFYRLEKCKGGLSWADGEALPVERGMYRRGVRLLKRDFQRKNFEKGVSDTKKWQSGGYASLVPRAHVFPNSTQFLVMTFCTI